MRRRSLLLGSAAMGLAGCSSAQGARASSDATAIADTSTIDPGIGPLTAIIEYQGNTYRYDQANGTDLGDYTDPLKRFVQGCIRVTHDQLPLTVFFRADRGTHRAEAVFELGRIWPKSPPANLDAYRATIMRGGRVVFAADVPRHFWFSRWRWQSSPRPVTTQVVDLISSGLLPHYDNRANAGTARPTPAESYQIMQLAGITPYMPSTGERGDIGPVTEQQAEFICTGRKSALETLLAQAEGAGTLPWYFRDEHTGAPLDCIHYAKASIYSPRTGDPFIARIKTGMVVDSAHQPAVAYLPFLLTGDPYHLETLQFQVTFNLIEFPPDTRLATHQVRGHAWSVRTLGQAAKVTPETTPRWLLPQSYFQEILNLQRDWMMHDFVESDDVVRRVFRTNDQAFGGRDVDRLVHGTFIAPWCEDFEAFIFGWLVQMGHTSWTPIHRWKVGSSIARTDGNSGWGRARPTTYQVALRAHRNDPWLRSWGAAWTLNVALQDWHIEDPDHLHLTQASEMTYLTYLRGALAVASRLGVAGANPSFMWLDHSTRPYLDRRFGAMTYKWSVT